MPVAKAAKYQLKNSTRFLQIIMSDNEIGFDDMYSEKIFAIFQRLHSRGEYEETGIGLAICKKMVEHHGGVIYANSSSTGGARFSIITPA